MFPTRARRWALPTLTFLLAAPVVAQDSLRILDPQSLSGAGAGWSVNPATGHLSMAFPFASVPGEIPITLPFQLKGSHVVESRRVKDPDAWEPTGPMRFSYITLIHDRPVHGGMSFGYIRPAADYDGFLESTTFVLEDGSQFREKDFTASFNPSGAPLEAPVKFKLAAKSWTQVKTHLSTRLITYDATLADLGSWSAKATSLAPQGFTATTAFKVVMDKDRARIYKFLPEMGVWAPLLWVDRFGHSVGFQWKKGTASGMTVYSVKALNQRSLGVQVQWAVPSTGTETEQVLLRADFLGFQSPSIQVTGYSGLASARPTALGGLSVPIDAAQAGPVLRPKTVQANDPGLLPAPAWISGGLPVPTTAWADPWGTGLAWNFAYDAAHAELTSFSDSLGVTTGFTYANHTLYDGLPKNTNKVRGVVATVSTDAQTEAQFLRNWTRTLPIYNSGWTESNWKTTLVQKFATGEAADIPTQEWTYAGPNNAAHYGNGALLAERLFTGTKTWSSQTYVPFIWGINGTFSGDGSPSLSVDGQPTRQVLSTPDGLTGLSTTETLQIGNVMGGGWWQTITTSYETKFGLLEPGRPISVTTSRRVNGVLTPGPIQKISYDPATGLPSRDWLESGSLQRGRSFLYDPEGHLTTVASFPAGTPSLSTFYTYGASGLPENAITTFSSPNGGTKYVNQDWTYNPAGRVLTATDGRGVTTTNTYNARGQVLSVAAPGTPTTTLAYPSERQQNWSSNAGTGLKGSETRDGFGRLLTRTRPGGSSTAPTGMIDTPTYDVLGRVTLMEEKNPEGVSRKSYTGFDPLGRTISASSTTSPMSLRIDYLADADGTSAKVTTTQTNPLGVGVASSRWTDPLGQPWKTSDPWSTVTSLFNAMGQPTEVKQVADGSTQTRSFGYNGLGDLTSRTEPETGIATFADFDALGNPTSIYDGIRNRTLAFDGLGRLRTASNVPLEVLGGPPKTWGDTESVSYVYNGLLLASSSTVSNGKAVSQDYAYGAATVGAKLASESTTLDGVIQTTRYGYDAFGRLQTLTYPSLRKATYGFDTLGRINLVSQIPSGTTTALKLADIEFDTWGNRNLVKFASNAKSEWLADLQGASLQAWTVTPYAAAAEVNGYALDANGNLKKGGGWSTLTHDPAGRLTAATGFGVTETLAHDGFGNNKSSVTVPLPTGSNNFTFAAMPNNKVPALTSTPTQASTGWNYQGNGEATQIGTLTGTAPTVGLSWDGLGRMASATSGGRTWKNTYAPSGMRVQLTDSVIPANSRKFAYTSGGILLGEYTGANAWKRDVIYLGSEAIAEIDGAGTHELHNDHLGSPRVITARTTGAVEGRQVFGPYGEKLPSYISGYQPLTGYTGHLQQDPSGLTYMRGRFYSPAWHRFVNSDQGVDSASWNQMAYVGGSPMQATDPSGMMIILSGGCVGEDWVISSLDTKSGTFTSTYYRDACAVGGGGTPGGGTPGGGTPGGTSGGRDQNSGGGSPGQTPKVAKTPCNKGVSWWPKSVGAQVGGQFDSDDNGGGSAQGAAGVLVTPFAGSLKNLAGAFATSGVFDRSSARNFVKGWFAGAGFSGVLSNASNTSQLSGPSTTYTFNAGAIISAGFSLSIGDNGVWSVTLSSSPLPGVGVGKSSTQYKTNTVTTPCIP